MTETILTDIPFNLDIPDLLKKLRIDGRPEYAERCVRLAEQPTALARPKAAYRLAYVESKGENTVVVDGVTLTSRVLRVNLGDVHRVFPFLITCGTELEAWSKSIDDMLERFWADTIMEEALRSAFDALTQHLVQRYDLGQTAMMNPGSLTDWPIEEQAGLFRILGGVSEQIGVKLTDSFLMVPTKSVSGLRFPTEATFENCELCPRDLCPNRRAPYDPGLYERRYSPAES
jgi:hypothetical protein